MVIHQLKTFWVTNLVNSLYFFGTTFWDQVRSLITVDFGYRKFQKEAHWSENIKFLLPFKVDQLASREGIYFLKITAKRALSIVEICPESFQLE